MRYSDNASFFSKYFKLQCHLGAVSLQGGAGIRGRMAADSEFEFAIGSDVGGGSCDEQAQQPQKGGLRSLLAQQPKSVGGEGEAVCSVRRRQKHETNSIAMHTTEFMNA